MNKDGLNLQKFIISVIIVGITLILGIYISSSIQTTTRDKDTAGLAVNESVTSSKTAGLSATLSANSRVDGACGTITKVVNGTGSAVEIPLSNFTQTGCTVVNASSMVPYHTALLFSYPYSYSADTAASNASGNVTDALSTGTSWISILVVVGFATIILTMLTSGLSSAAGESQVPYY